MTEDAATKPAWDALLADEAVRVSLEELCQKTLDWLADEPLGALAPEEKVAEWHRALTDPTRREAIRGGLERLLDDGRERLLAERRTASELMGERAAKAACELAEAWEPDEASIRRLVRGEAGERMMASVLFDGIMEFVRRADILGPIVDRIPVLGGLRRRIMSGLKEEFERRAERQVRLFLETFAKAAVDRAVRFIVSDENRSLMRRARGELAARLLELPLRELAVGPARHEKIRRALTDALDGWLADPTRLDDLHRRLRERYKDETARGLRERYGLPDPTAHLAPPLAALALRWLARPEAQAWTADHPLPPPVAG